MAVHDVVHSTKPAVKRDYNEILNHRGELVAHQDLGMGLQAVRQRCGRGGGIILELHCGERRTHYVGLGGMVGWVCGEVRGEIND